MARKRAKASAGDAADGGRRLVVVVAFDVVNFSALVEADEERVLGAWRALRQAIDPLIVMGGGRIFKALGDGLLVEFTGPVDATRAALAVQAAVAEPALTADTAVRLELRCAIHMGEVTVEGTDLLGDGINVVSRLQEHAPIGGVLVSAAVMDLIAGRIEQPIEELGPLKLRNMSRPVHAYAVGPSRRGLAAAAGALPGALLESAASPLVDSFQRRRPSIAVLPFVDQTEDDGASWFSDGLVEAIISALSCLPELIVISRASVLRYRGQVHEPQRVRRELAVRYMLTGSVHRSGDKVRLSAELCDCESGTAIWTDRFACAAAELFELQDELSARVASTIAPPVQESELRRVMRKHPESLDAYESVLRGLDLLYRVEDDPWQKALPLFERAIALDPRYAAAYALAATCHGERFYEGTSPDPRADHMEAERLSRRALVRPLRSPGAVVVRRYPPLPVHLGCSTTTTMRSSCSTGRWRPIPVLPSPGCAAAPPSATSARRARRAAASRSGSASRPTTRMSSSPTGWPGSRPMPAATMPRRRRGGGAP